MGTADGRASGELAADFTGTFGAALAGRYAVERAVGRGGMATVFRARDLRHGRLVALKVLRPDLGAVLGVERFLSEIRVTAALQHPNVLPLFDSGEAAGQLFYVMPYVEGESLRERLTREGQLPVEDAVRIAWQAAGALDYAHRRGVVHRDMKPENVLLDGDGHALVADFGIARAVERAAADRPAGSGRLTGHGVALGTPPYMSPEQAAGERDLDARSDVYALGCVLYEMLAGAPPFTAPTPQGVIARVMTEEPAPVTQRRRTVPPALAAAVHRALEKVPADRFATAQAFADALDRRSTPAAGSPSIAGTPAADARPTTAAPARTTRDRALRALPWAVAALALGAVVAQRAGRRPERAPAPRVTRFLLPLQAGDRVVSEPGRVAISPDGRTVAYLVARGPDRQMYVRRLDQLQSTALPGTAGRSGNIPFFSPDGRSIAFFAGDEKLKRVSVDGGTPVVVAEAIGVDGSGAWAPGGTLVIAQRFRGLSTVSADGGAMRPLTALDTTAAERGHQSLQLSPDGRTVAFIVDVRRGAGPSVHELALAPLDGPAGTVVRHTRLGLRGSFVVGFADGWLVYANAQRDAFMAVRFDGRARRVTGPPRPVLQEPGGLEYGTLAADGTLLYVRQSARLTPALVDGRGGVRPVVPVADAGRRQVFMNPRLSPDGRRLAVLASPGSGSDVWLYDLASGTPTRLTTTGTAGLPEWTPDGRRLAFPVNTRELWWQPADGSGPAERLVEAPGLFAARFTPDGRTLVFQRQLDNVWSLWTARVDGDRVARPLLREAFSTLMPAVSPDGRWLAYTSNETEQNEVYVRPFPGPGAPVRVSEGGGTEPVWSRDGRRLFYRDGQHLVAATVVASTAFTVPSRERLFADPFDGNMPHANYDVAPEGGRFAVIAATQSSAPEAVVVLNWPAELRARLGAWASER